jgi:GDP-L-fucose synthase
MNTKDKIYVAGHKGLVGSALVKTLTNKGYTNIIGRSIDELDLRDPAEVDKEHRTQNMEVIQKLLIIKSHLL